MALKRYQETFGSVQAGGDVFVLAGASVEVREETSGSLAAIFEDRDGNTAKANPFTTDSNGFGFFYAADGRYRVTATLLGETVDVRDVLLGVGATTVTTSTGEQTVIAALDGRVNKGAVGSEVVTTESGTESLVSALNNRSRVIDSILTVNIPTDYATLQAAIDDLSGLSFSQAARVDLTIESGHTPASGVLVTDGDYSKFIIKSVDAVVSLDPSFPSSSSFVSGQNAIMPTLSAKIDAGGLGKHGYIADLGSKGRVTPGNGVINAGGHGLYANDGSSVEARNTVWTGASQSSDAWSGILAWASRISAPGADVSNSVRYGAQAAAGGILSFRGGTANNTGRYGIRATNMGFIDAREAQAESNAIYGIYAYIGSTINCMGADVDLNGTANIIAARSSVIDAGIEGAAVTTCNGGGSAASVYATFNSRIHCSGIAITNSNGHGALAESGSVITIGSASINTVAGNGLRATSSSTINAVNTTITTADYGARALASIISVRSAAFSGITNEPVYIEGGATVQAHGATAGGGAFDVTDTNADALNAFSSTGPAKGIVWA